MATEITNYQCPACTGPLHYSASSGKLACEYCDSSFEIAEIEALYAAQNAAAEENFEEPLSQETEWDSSELTDDWGDTQNMRTYNCPSCGAELICDDTTAATACPYCGNPSVVPGQFSGALRPDYVIPFRVEKNQAVSILKDLFRKKILIPREFLDTHTIEKIQGIYVPFWLYDGEVSGNYRFDARNIRIFRTGDWEVTETSHYRVNRSGSLQFEKVPVDASSKMPDAYMESIEPFDYSQLKPFSAAFLPGYLADKYDVTVEDSNKRADERCIRSLDDAVQNTVIGYTSCTLRARNTTLKRGKVHYALLPVWLLNVKWNDKTYLFAINGQSGKAAGTIPASKAKALAFFAALALPLSLLGILLANLMVG